MNVRILTIFFYILLKRSGCFEMLGIRGPDWVNREDTVELVCKYNTAGNTVYSIKWYKDEKEIWRYLPGDNPNNRSFDLPGLKVHKSTTKDKLVVRVKGAKGSGTYKCEISVEAPTFLTKSVTRNLTVIVPPVSAPEITGGSNYYREGDQMEVNCTSRKSKPAAKLSWKINSQSAPPGYVLKQETIFHSDSGLETSTRGLRFLTERRHFPGGIIKLRCEANIAGGVWATSQSQILQGGGKTTADKRNLVSHGSSIGEVYSFVTWCLFLTLGVLII